MLIETFKCLYESPIWKLGENEIAFVGELDKWTMISPNRFTNIDISTDVVYISVQGVPDEEIHFRFLFKEKNEFKIFDEKCVITQSGKNLIVFDINDNQPYIYCQDV